MLHIWPFLDLEFSHRVPDNVEIIWETWKKHFLRGALMLTRALCSIFEME